MAQDAALTFTRTLAVWSLPSGDDISSHGHPLGIIGTIAGTTLDNITAGVFDIGDSARTANPFWLSISNLSFEFLIQPTTLTGTGFILRVGDPATTPNPSIAIRILASGGNFFWSMIRKGALGATTNVNQVSDSTVGPTFGTVYHVVCVIGNNQFNQIFVNGDAIPLTHVNTFSDATPAPAGALTGAVPIPINYELQIGDPSTTQNTFLGTLGRVVVYPYAVTRGQAQASLRLQLGQPLMVGMSAETLIGGANRGPVAVPFVVRSGSIVDPDGTKFIDIDVVARAFDAEGAVLTPSVPPTAPFQGESSIVGGKVRYIPATGTGGDLLHEVPFRISDPSGTALRNTASAWPHVTSSSSTGKWWQNLPATRSQRTGTRASRRSGTSYWNNQFSRYDAAIALCDTWNGGRQDDQRTATMARTTGGPMTGTPAAPNTTIDPNGNLEWNGGGFGHDHWSYGWVNLPRGTVAIWAVNLTSVDRQTQGGDDGIWQSILDGDFDQAYINTGARIKLNYESVRNVKNHNPAHLILRLFHENNQTNYYMVRSGVKTKYRDAMDRAIGFIRQGGDTVGDLIHFAHAPAWGPGSAGTNLGGYLTWCPTLCDVLSVSWHPGNTADNQAGVDAYMNGNGGANNYGPIQLKAASDTISTLYPSGRPMVFPEWGIRSKQEGSGPCPVADLALDAFDDFLVNNANMMISDCVYDDSHITKGVYVGTPAGFAAWDRMVDMFATRWSGTKG